MNMVYECPSCHGLAGNHRGSCEAAKTLSSTVEVRAVAKWIRFDEQSRDRFVTKLWQVTAIAGDKLGEVKWFGRWRKYAFFPAPGTVYEKDCLRDIADFCESQTKAHTSSKVSGSGSR